MNGDSDITPQDSIEIQVRGEVIQLLGSRAAFWPRTRTLLLADLHLGKAQALRTLGAALPATAMLRQQIKLLEAACSRTGATRILVLGDLLHAPSGLTEDVITAFGDFTRHSGCCMQVVPGNHDRMLHRVAAASAIEVLPESHTEGPFEFTHEPASGQRDRFVWCGHLHPAITLGGRADRIKLPCFRLNEHRCILPAFS
ncbi:MAG: ligase-associated DNA damage response endonuclease PdeM, partial [Planctomycetota bacterium]|nr:ligase-associated DNA damage response endonuclease PdeM [Planctomycetota bacterium]